ncbi:abortive infection family protein [Microbacterium oleivorans]|uniref:Abortive infection family protein n=1 Tax=Microbacterium oleivorans TaxID=273677 RepID=A0A7D5EU58_9MICO|nr:abortive infection family protein [Microbacterium oleivorans]QLD10812.1 abortive infection family protein [Microbacterium oleivorans]
MPQNRITVAMRTDIFDWLALSSHHWAGDQEEPDFLSRLFDLRSLPSTDGRPQYPTAAEDIWQHRVNNRTDWDDNWVFGDSRFNLWHVDDGLFLQFLVQTVNPAVRRDPAAAAAMVQAYNDVLRRAGIELAEDRRVGEGAYYRPQNTSGVNSPSAMVVAPPDVKNTDVLAAQLTRLRRDIDTDPAAAIAHCKELIESQCKLVLSELGKPYDDRAELPALYRAASEALGIHAQSVSGDARASEAIRTVLRSLASVVQNVSAARNAMGTGHGRGTASPAERRHARLVFNATVAITEFVADTWSAH